MLKILKSKRLRNATSILLGLIFFTAGMAKLYADHKFPGLIGPVWLEDELRPHGLGFYARFIAYSQVFIGFLLLTLRYSTLGAIMSIPLVTNILMVTISLQWQGTPMVLSGMLAMNIYLLIYDSKKLLPIINPYFFVPGNKKWLLGFLILILGIPISFYQLYLSYFVVVTGLTISFVSLKTNRQKLTNNDLRA